MAAYAESRHLTCLVTIHGIGFQQPPLKNGTPGYADALHRRLRHYLDTSVLGDDPGRTTPGPVYVQRHWPPESQDFEAGPARLGTWDDVERRRIKPNPPALVSGNSRIAHVALVYSHLEDHGFHLGSAFEAAADPLAPASHWHRGDGLPPSVEQVGMLQAVDPDTAALVPVPITDVKVDNLAHSAGGGLQAHNYWDNDQQFVHPLAEALKAR
jgi:hypothetical protein